MGNIMTKETLNTIAKTVLILSDIAYSGEEKFKDDIVKLDEYLFSSIAGRTWFRQFQGIVIYDLFSGMKFIYCDERVEIKIQEKFYKHISHIIVSLKDYDIEPFFRILKEEFPDLYDEVWLNYSNPKYNIEFYWEFRKIAV